ncbi:penicillin-binding protein 2 [Bacillus sp. V2I10]|uniref:peptidoglycan D,D-transpeptidase FtsI family protein n=1 Tax=Bacillus sp. V2I10 TaxID=3042276 RepID=UPI002787BB66|nr:penicillin-binding protein 2 [Bacillus sp. V2I10]MDQ0860441.1 cell division protein FtsI/penicillin-binding protein 2 [Bacillus sp. V2I10]
MTEPSNSQADLRKLKKTRLIRINVFFFFVFLLFVALIIRLGVVQIVQGEEFSKEVSRTESNYASFPAPRGKMYDRNGNVLVENIGVEAITYTVEKTTKASDKIETAKVLASLIEVPTEFLKDRDLKDYWVAANPEEAAKLLKPKEKEKKGSETYQLQIDRVPEAELNKLKGNKNELEVVALYTRFSAGYAYEPQIVKATDLTKGEELTKEELTRVAENLELLPGIDVITDWKRSYPNGDLLTGIFGSVTTPKQGILEARKSYYTARGYARNERVGRSNLEYQYEDYLNPRKAKVQYVTDSSGKVISETMIDEGRRGYDLKLSFDLELQKQLDTIVEEELRVARGKTGNHLVDRAFAVMMDPNTGDVLAMSGKKYSFEEGKINDYIIGNFTSQYEIGSTIKGATVLAGYQNGMSRGTVYNDTPLLIKDTKPKKSVRNMGPVSDITALKRSSNVYMFRVAYEIAGENYIPNSTFNASSEDFQKMRNYYSQFGLGVPTGIDLPNESIGQQSVPPDAGILLNMAIGQFDTYTPLQMAQYVSVIANGGYRVEPRIVTSIHSPVEDEELGSIVTEHESRILNRINNSEEDIRQVQRGFEAVTQTGGTAAGIFGEYDVAGKTGTSQTSYYGEQSKRAYWGTETNNLAFVGYYPASKPEVAISVIVPYTGKTASHPVNKYIAKRAIEAYANLEPKDPNAETEQSAETAENTEE